jgi:ketosteroid isomerase-like protein
MMIVTFALPASAQTSPGILPLAPPTQAKIIPLPSAKLTPDLLHLIELESRFSADVAKGGGKAFASWFAPDGVTLSNGQAAVLGQRDIAAHATWDPKDYQLTWVPEGAQLSPSGDMGFTWGHYDATTTHPGNGQPSQTSGRYITIWKHVPGGDWKVALDASADDAPAIPAP